MSSIEISILLYSSSASSLTSSTFISTGVPRVGILPLLLPPVGLELLFIDLSTLHHRIRNLGGEETNSADGVVISRDDIIHILRIAIGVDDADRGMPIFRASRVAILSFLGSTTKTILAAGPCS